MLVQDWCLASSGRQHVEEELSEQAVNCGRKTASSSRATRAWLVLSVGAMQQQQQQHVDRASSAGIYGQATCATVHAHSLAVSCCHSSRADVTAALLPLCCAAGRFCTGGAGVSNQRTNSCSIGWSQVLLAAM